MPRKKQFIASHGLETLASASIPFTIKKMDINAYKEYEDMIDPHRHNYYMLAIGISGTSPHMIDMESFTLTAGQMGLIVPGQVHKALPGGDGVGYGMAFTAHFLPQMSLPVAAVGPVAIPEPEFSNVLQLVTFMERELEHPQANTMAILQHYLTILLMTIQRYCGNVAPVSSTLITRYRELVSTHFLEWTRPAQYAEALHISVDYLNELVRQQYGQTASSLITEQRILEARRLLLHADESIKEIAWHLRFSEVSYFNRFFKQHTGSTPAAFRANVRDKSSSAPE